MFRMNAQYLDDAKQVSMASCGWGSPECVACERVFCQVPARGRVISPRSALLELYCTVQFTPGSHRLPCACVE